MKIWERGGVRFAFEKDGVHVFVDADKLADAKEFDVPEVEIGHIDVDDVRRVFGHFWSDVKDEAGRVKARMKASRNKKRVKKMGG